MQQRHMQSKKEVETSKEKKKQKKQQKKIDLAAAEPSEKNVC